MDYSKEAAKTITGSDLYKNALNNCIDDLEDVIQYYKNTNEKIEETKGFAGITISLQNQFGKYTIHSKQYIRVSMT